VVYKRDLTDDQIGWQLEAFLDYEARGGDVERWFISKDLAPGDLRELRRQMALRNDQLKQIRELADDIIDACDETQAAVQGMIRLLEEATDAAEEAPRRDPEEDDEDEDEDDEKRRREEEEEDD
jgi:hypothetical protein